MINTVLFDLDGTLLQLSQNAFLKTYLAKIEKVFQRLDMDPEESIKALWIGTAAMVLNDGSMTNAERFWEVFSKHLSLDEEQCRIVEAACNEFYTTEFDTVKEIMAPNDFSQRLVRALRAKGYGVVLATNPLFPSCAVVTRLNWIGLTVEDFDLVTHYTNSTFCKPNPLYYEEVFAKINRLPGTLWPSAGPSRPSAGPSRPSVCPQSRPGSRAFPMASNASPNAANCSRLSGVMNTSRTSATCEGAADSSFSQPASVSTA